MTHASFVLRVRSGKQRHTHAVIAPGQALRVGHGEPAELVIAADRRLGLVHFTLWNDGTECHLTCAGTVGEIWVNGLSVTSCAVPHGAWLRAGETDFSLYREGHTPPLDEPEETEQKRAALSALGGAGEPLFGVFDSARDMRVLELLRESRETVASLYDGEAGEAMADGAPYLAAFSAGGESGSLLSRLVAEGWGRSWGIYLESSRPFVEVRRHLRRFLVVKNDETEERLYFRYYDPRVLRVFLPTCTQRQRGELFAEVSRYWLEGEDGGVVTFEKGAARGRA
ncbi:MAG: DUF4123 domain-containing protein [Polyangiaceae bacterium]